MNKMIYSDSLDEMVIFGFSIHGVHYTWNDDDCVYWSDMTDDDYYMEVPKNAIIDR